jgi:phosphatidylinositol phospholipase C delta
VLSIPDDMTHPLPHYFIATSHNTYLEGGQLISTSSTEAYVRAFSRGCRCVELDLSNGNENPRNSHRGVFTSSIDAKLVVEKIGQVAFETTETPVILSLETLF